MLASAVGRHIGLCAARKANLTEPEGGQRSFRCRCCRFWLPSVFCGFRTSLGGLLKVRVLAMLIFAVKGQDQPEFASAAGCAVEFDPAGVQIEECPR